MIDLKFLRENPDVVKENIKKKFQDEKLPLVDEVIELDKRSREIKGEVEALRAEKNKVSKEIGACMAHGEKEKAEELKKEAEEKTAAEEKENKPGGFHYRQPAGYSRERAETRRPGLPTISVRDGKHIEN